MNAGDARVVTRFAPSPTGALHEGHAFAALFAWEHAMRTGGRFLLRIEDIDQSRARPEHEAAIKADLAWLGLVWPEPARRQSEHFATYRAALDRLDAMGLLYPCFCTRADILREIQAASDAPHGPDGPIYPGLCKHLGHGERARRIDAGAPFALRLDMDEAVRRVGRLSFEEVGRGMMAAEPWRFGDLVLARKDVPASYHLAVIIDDAADGVSLVTRGVDLLPATSVHRLLQALLDLPVPRWKHHPLITGPDGEKLSKRRGSPTLLDLRRSGLDAGALRRRLGFA